MKRRAKNIVARYLAFVMVLIMAFPASAQAAVLGDLGETTTVSGNDYLGQEIAMITADGKAVQIDAGIVKANGAVEAADGGVKVSDSANFTITKHSTENYYAINNTKTNQFLQLTGFDWSSTLTVTAGNGQWNAESLNQAAWEGLVVEAGDAGQYLLTTTVRFNKDGGQVQLYAKADSDGVLGVTTEKAEATGFYFALVKGAIETDEPEQGSAGLAASLKDVDVAFVTADGKALSVCEESELVKVDAATESVEGGVKAIAESTFVISESTAAAGVYAINNDNVEGGKFLLIVEDRVFYRAGSYANPAEGAWEGFVIEQDETDADAYYLTTTSRCNPQVYAKMNDSGELKCTTDKSTATKFYISLVKEIVESTGDSGTTETPDSPVVPAPSNGEFTIEHVASGKLIKTYETDGARLTVDGEEGDKGTIFSKAAFGVNDNNNMGNPALPTMSFISKDYGKGIASVVWTGAWPPSIDYVFVNGSTSGGGWESVQIVANGDGTVSFKDVFWDKYMTVEEVDGVQTLKCDSDKTADTLTDNEKFVINSTTAPDKVENLAVTAETRTSSSLDLTWTKPNGIYTNIHVYQKSADATDYTEVANLGEATSYTATGLTADTEYSFKLVFANGNGNAADITCSTESNVATAKTRSSLVVPAVPANVKLEENGDKFVLSWDVSADATHYQVLRAESMYGTYEVVATVKTNSAEITYAGNKYENYYRVIALNNGDAGDTDFSGAEKSEQSIYVSLETNLFGYNTLVFAPTDDVAKIDETLQALYDAGSDSAADAQFKGEHWQVYFKPGDYTTTSCINLGFYTSINGLGETPYDVKLNNVAIPAYLADYNATCNFWRSMENVSIINTGNEQGVAQYGSWRGNDFNWGVAQAAPLRRVYSTRPVSYDWNYGWASGGYVADCYFTSGAGTWSGQQFYTRNSKIEGDAFGTTLNNFFQGVEAANLPNAAGVEAGTASALLNGNGYSNWSIPDASGNQQVFTNVETSPESAEKPFLYIDDNGEYKVFVPALRKDTKGISWSEDDMGEGTSLALDTFYIAKPGDSAATINAQLAAGKNIYFTPGIYYAEESIKVNNANTVLLGTGLATIIPDDGVSETIEYAAIEVADVDGVRVAGLVIDAGEHSEYLMVVGDENSGADHSANPTILQDIFFRVGGTTDELTKSDDALIINSDDVITDHFWIWRADHGAGVEWYGNESAHGLIVNGDDVTCYALFNEHFQEYNTLWNGENGATYFYQNETCYDPISQEAWMSHDGTVNGYSSYKVADDVENHYAVGLGIYNVFIYTGPTYDATEVQIQLDNAVEVPDADGVLVENVCLQTFANDDGALQKINSIVNGYGDPVSSGTDAATGEVGTGWNRTFLAYYRNGVALGSSREVVAAEAELQDAYDTYSAKVADITDEAQKAKLEAALADAKDVMDEIGVYVTWSIDDELTAIADALSNLKEAAVNAGVLTGEEADAVIQEREAAKDALEAELAAAAELVEADYTSDSWEDCQDVISAAQAVAADEEATITEIKAATKELQDAMAGLVDAPVIPTEPGNPEEPGEPEEPGDPQNPTEPVEPSNPGTTTESENSGNQSSTQNQTTTSNQETQTAAPAESAEVVAPVAPEATDEQVAESAPADRVTDEEVEVQDEVAEESVEEPSEEVIIEDEEVAAAPGIGGDMTASNGVNGETDGPSFWWIIALGVAAVTVLTILFVIARKKEEEESI